MSGTGLSDAKEIPCQEKPTYENAYLDAIDRHDHGVAEFFIALVDVVIQNLQKHIVIQNLQKKKNDWSEQRCK